MSLRGFTSIASNAAMAASGSSSPTPGISCSTSRSMMPDEHHPSPLHSSNNSCTPTPISMSMSAFFSDQPQPPPPPPLSHDPPMAMATPTLDEAERKKAERAQQRKLALEMKAQRASEYEERWRQKCAQDVTDDMSSWASGWKQPLAEAQDYGGWDYTPTPVPDYGVHQYPSWKRKLHPEQLDGKFGGWDQHLGSLSSEDAPLGGWLYPDPSEPLDDYQTEVEILGKKVMVTVASKGATVERWLEGRKEAAKWGLDIEWRPTFQKGDYHYASLLQLSLEECCLLIQLQFIDTLPESLKKLLADPEILKGGVGILADTNKLKNDHDLICAGEVELTTLAVSTLRNTSLKKTGIATLTEKILGVPYKKNKRATMSNWEIRDLTYAQIQYAAADAWLSYSILMVLLNYKQIPAAPPGFEGTASSSMVHHSPNPQSTEDYPVQTKFPKYNEEWQ